MNVPNILTSLRILVALTVPFFVINGSYTVRIVVGIVCLLAILTDWVDGWYARKYNQITKIGKILDPIADKVLVIVSLSVFVYLDVLSIWWVIPIFIREIVITVYRFIFLARGTIVAAVTSGKIKTIMQMFSIGAVYTLFMINKHFKEYFFDWYWQILYVILSVTLILTIQSGIVFFKNNWRIVKRYHNLA